MAAGPHSIDPTTYLDDLLSQASPDLMRQMLQNFINQILSTQADQICGADYATVSDNRTNVRNGYRHRDLDTRVGTIDVAVPKLRTGSYFPDWLLERRTRARPPESRHGGCDQEADLSVTGHCSSNTAGARYLHQECRRVVL